MKMNSAKTLLFVLPFAFVWGPAFAGDGNTIYVLQDRTEGNSGNTLFVDQSGANNSLVGGLSDGLNASREAKQLGGDNDATLKITGDGGTIQLLQSNTAVGPNTGNTATVKLTGGGTALVSQIGSLNSAHLTVDLGDKGAIEQNGDLNDATLKVEGSGAMGKITQNGNNNETTLNVTGAGSNVSYTLNGSNVTTNIPGNAVQVYTNGATVTITQTAF